MEHEDLMMQSADRAPDVECGVRGEDLLQQLADAQTAIRSLQEELALTNRGLVALTLELEQRVDARTAQLRQAHAELQQTNSELMQLTLELEDRVARRTEEIRSLNEELQRRVAQRTADLDASNQELSSFSYSLSHDLRAPLRAMDGFSYFVLEECGERLDAQGNAYLQRVRAASQRMDKLVDGILELARTARCKIQRVAVDLSGMAEAIARRLQKSERSRDAEFVIAPGLVVSADAALIRIVLENLMENAWKFTSLHPRARIELGAMERQGETVYFVRDDGAGFDMAYATKLFGAFQRLHSPADFEGTGIGLAVVQRIIHRHGGWIWAEGKVQRGATFYFTLPGAAGTEGRQEEPAASSRASQASGTEVTPGV